MTLTVLMVKLVVGPTGEPQSFVTHQAWVAPVFVSYSSLQLHLLIWFEGQLQRRGCVINSEPCVLISLIYSQIQHVRSRLCSFPNSIVSIICIHSTAAISKHPLMGK